MLTNVLFGQMRTGAADPASAKATESRQANRSFSEHMEDRAKREQAKSASEKERSNQPDKAAERQETKENPKETDQSRPKAGTASAVRTARDGAKAVPSKEGAKTAETAAEFGATQGEMSALTEEPTEGTATTGTGETTISENDSNPETAPPTAETEGAAQTTEVPPVAARQDADLKPETTKAAGNSQTSDATGKVGRSGGPQAVTGEAAEEKSAAPLTLAEAAPDSMTAGGDGDIAPDPRGSVQPTAATQAAAGTAGTIPANSEASATTQTPATTQNTGAVKVQDPVQLTVAQEQELSDKPQLASTTAPTQERGPRPGDTRTAATSSLPMSQASGADDAAVTTAAPTDEVAADTAADGPESAATTKTASSAAEVMAAIAGQSRSTTSSEPGRRAEGRARESSETQAVVSGNATPTAANKSAAAAAQISAVQQAFAAQVLAGDASGAAGQGAEAQLFNSELPSDLPGLSQLLTEAVVQPGTVHRPETPRLVAVQLAEAIVAKGDRNVDVALNPEELGRVKMRVSTSETGITVVIQTERSETGDLMRRHIHELADEFRKMGFTNVSFEFSGGGASGGNTSSEGDSQSGSGTSGADGLDDLTSAELAETQVQHLRLGNAGVDMRV
ncbi:flagellar hook-length control protein FliK [Pseudophaeobacter sp.]|uniref:flagellar hook-length control protein FliK n=1 Tax=Pseudophaeobacter sp. TaxID=1971739 RepID=UPI00329A49EC